MPESEDLIKAFKEFAQQNEEQNKRSIIALGCSNAQQYCLRWTTANSDRCFEQYLKCVRLHEPNEKELKYDRPK